ncbi:hypothetical protein LTR99_001243 [Exophiala xenobiotica]|uniref:Major facilitator superfamily (MFS) profile domain-containing protein n=1 Tax=Vermiconidia calcicola TaxID=1690605 RepID=A0AAV9QP70_9PEZI|nr:hypothetical protein LTR41_005954 [Exophiala xenobiotica]KAK5545804.1 hypothetical protein LTR25_000814 [Vermiconidia calcicola]KAK5549935.1 hypothetical protein LTR23_000226 [Chaetothyriales sp. CCFEE 6169]KAK5229815.1 hypothetical protein LTR72_001347 [Exophiala xenobiotica]KAK5271602.1 hypothetical protein LTR96_003427 [Exophiala xenobiotica]
MGRPGEKDIAASVVPEFAQPWDKQVERRLVRKIDLIIIPFMWFGYGLVYYDKAILGGATVFGMSTDLKLRVITDPTTTPPKVSTTRLSWATSLFYFGMLTGVVPLTYLFQRFHLGRTIGLAVIAWGAIAMSTAGVTTYRGLWAQRFFLGFAESIMPTAFMIIVSGYYTQAEQTWRQCIWYSATGGWTIIGALINYGFAHITGGDLKKWQYLYLMAGAVTVLYGALFLSFPNSPAQAWWFTDEEKRVAVERLRMSQTGVRCQKIKWPQFREACLDPKVWIIAIMMGAAYTVNGAVSGFGPLIVSTFGWSAYDSLLWQMPLGGVCLVGILLVGYLSLKVSNIRLIMLIACCLPVIAGCAMIWKSTWYEHAATPIAGYTIIGFFAPVTSLIVSMGMSNVAGNTKKSFMAAAIFVFYTVGNISGPFWIKSETVSQHYPRLWGGIIGCYALVIVLAIVLYVLLMNENRRRNRLNLEEKEAERVAFDDLTDKENLHFRYVFALRRCASRLLSSRSTTFVSASRTYSSLTTSPLRSSTIPAFQSQRRWATTESEKPAISNENITEDAEEARPAAEANLAPSDDAPPIAETANATEATDEALPAAETNERFAAETDSAGYTMNTGDSELAPDNLFDRKRTLYIGNLFFDVTENDLVKEFARFGTVTKAKIVRDSRGLSKGFAYIDYSTQEAADTAMERLNMQLFEGRRITVQYAARPSSPADPERRGHGRSFDKPRNAPSKTLFIGNMSFEMTDRDLSNLFRGIRNVIDVRVAIDRRTGQPRGFAHADFIDVKSAMDAMQLLSEKEIYGRKLRVDYSFSSANRAPRNEPSEPSDESAPQ